MRAFSNKIVYNAKLRKGIQRMVKRIALFLTDYFCKKNWIDQVYRSWLYYRIICVIQSLFFYLSVFIYSLLSSCLLDVSLFLFPLISLRRITGGWHANTPLQCYLLSMALVALATKIIGPVTFPLPLYVHVIVCIVLQFALLLQRPVYPKQLHLSKEEITANLTRKQKMLISLGVLQFISTLFSFKKCLVYSNLAGVISFLSIHYEREKQKYETI